MTPSHRSDFLRDLKAAFPDVRERVNGRHGLLHLEMSVFSDVVQAAIDSGDAVSVSKAFDLAKRHFLQGSPALRNAIAVSFLEHLHFEDGRARRKWAWDLLPASLKDVVNILNAQSSALGKVRPRARKAKLR